MCESGQVQDKINGCSPGNLENVGPKFKIERKTQNKNYVPVQNIYWVVFISEIT